MRLLQAIIFTLIVLKHEVSSDRIRYDDFQVIRLNILNTKLVPNVVQELGNLPNLKFLTNFINNTIDVLVSPEDRYAFDEIVGRFPVRHHVSIPNIQDLIDNEQIKREDEEFNWNTYSTLDEINEWLESLATDYPDKITLVEGGSTYEVRKIIGVKLSFSPANENRTVVFEGNIHAREWITSAVVTYVLNELLTSKDEKIREIAESYDWYIFPVTNPDGFVYTHTTDRMWRKTRTPYLLCDGADPNRNWDYHYNEGGTSINPCSESYRGPKAFSEECTRTFSEFLTTIGHKLVGYVAFHSYSQLLLIPYGYSSDHLDNFDELYDVGLKAAESLAQRYGTKYTVGNIVETIYVASGGSMDWVKGTFNTPITYTYELRDTGKYGFILPPEQIIPTAEETLDSLITIFTEFKDRV